MQGWHTRPHHLSVSNRLNYSRFLWWRSGAGIYPYQIPCAFIIKMEFGFRAEILYLDVGDVDVPIVYRAYSGSTWKRKEIVLFFFWNEQRDSTFLPSSIDLDLKTCKLHRFVICGVVKASVVQPCSKYKSWITRGLYWLLMKPEQNQKHVQWKSL